MKKVKKPDFEPVIQNDFIATRDDVFNAIRPGSGVAT